ncbi:Rho-associated protein kinase 2 [Elasticomyces elasticus]|nr:Rho-associated protein kinase 2 [Elasticomyces elasticus]KAK3643659.1 Rho-associated protein kinase 2 [Elasticomyces elasticus]KAK4915169.1 Rho-associated protein kinase 2 [Elasticomyces elasticus]KAK5749325.1 Rho-associated protein kinase 2 [Elasticomyces elasticus]
MFSYSFEAAAKSVAQGSEKGAGKSTSSAPSTFSTYSAPTLNDLITGKGIKGGVKLEGVRTLSTGGESLRSIDSIRREYAPAGMNGRGGISGSSNARKLASTTTDYAPNSALSKKGFTDTPRHMIRVFETTNFTFEVIKTLTPHAEDHITVGKGLAPGVNMVRCRNNDQIYAEKVVTMGTEYQRNRAMSEVNALTQIMHGGAPDYINNMLESFYSPGAQFGSIILEYCDAGTMFDKIERLKDKKDMAEENFAWNCLAGLSKALHFIHTGIDVGDAFRSEPKQWNTLCHLDIKPLNIFFSYKGSKNGYPRLVLGDFGSATTWRDIQSGQAERTVQLRGTPSWMPPECKKSELGGFDGHYGIPTDAFGMGAVIQALCRLLTAPQMESVRRKRACGGYYTVELQNVVSSCMGEDVMKRPSAGQVAKYVKEQMEKYGMAF